MTNHFWQLFKTLNIVLITLIAVFLIQISPVLAHRPHDVIEQVDLSPQFEQDKTLFIVVRNNLFKSTDEGINWTRIVKGLDAKGQISSLAISLQNKNILYLSTLGSGIYKSEDGGNSWNQVNQGLDNLNFDNLKISPVSSEIVIIAGTKQGLYKTQDSGKNWVEIFDGNIKISTMAFWPTETNKIIIGDNQGNLYLSNDSGETWKKFYTFKDSGSIRAIAFSPELTTDNTFFVGTEKEGIFKTTNQGNSFEQINQDIPDKNIEDIVVSSNYLQDSILYISTWHEGVFQSKNGGKTWQKHSNGLTKDTQADQLKSPHFSDLAVFQKTLFIGGFDGLFKSLDEGQNWQEVETLSRGTITALAISPNYQNDSTLVAVTYVGNIFISQDKGATWTPINKGLERPRFSNDKEEIGQDPRRFFDVAFSPNYASDQTLFAGILWSKIVKLTDGDFWKIIPLGKEVRGVKIIPSPNFAADKTIYVGNQEGIIFKSIDGGNTFSQISKLDPVFGNDPPSIVISPNFSTDRTLFAIGKNIIYKTVDSGTKWQDTTKGTPIEKRVNVQLAISPNYKIDQTVFASTDSGLFVTKDGGKSWSKLEKTLFDPDSFMEGVALSPNYQNDQTLIVSVRGKGLYKSIDGGQNFDAIGDVSLPITKIHNLPSSGIPIQFSPSYATDQTLFGFGGAKTTVYKSTDGGNSWQAITIAKPPEEKEDFWTSASIFFQIYRGHFFRILTALIAAVAGYILSGTLSLEKNLPLSKSLIKAAIAFIIFVIVLFVLFNL